MDGSPASRAPTESRYTILEARIASEWQQVGSCSDPEFQVGTLLIRRMVVSKYPEFAIHPVPLDKWLASKMLAVTSVYSNADRHSTTSWVCIYDGCESMSEVVDGGDVYVLTKARFLL